MAVRVARKPVLKPWEEILMDEIRAAHKYANESPTAELRTSWSMRWYYLNGLYERIEELELERKTK